MPGTNTDITSCLPPPEPPPEPLPVIRTLVLWVNAIGSVGDGRTNGERMCLQGVIVCADGESDIEENQVTPGTIYGEYFMGRRVIAVGSTAMPCLLEPVPTLLVDSVLSHDAYSQCRLLRGVHVNPRNIVVGSWARFGLELQCHMILSTHLDDPHHLFSSRMVPCPSNVEVVTFYPFGERFFFGLYVSIDGWNLAVFL